MLRVVARMTLSSHSVAQVAQLRRELRRAKRSIRDADDVKRRLQTLEQENVDLKAGQCCFLVVCFVCLFICLLAGVCEVKGLFCVSVGGAVVNELKMCWYHTCAVSLRGSENVQMQETAPNQRHAATRGHSQPRGEYRENEEVDWVRRGAASA